jgi:hypothetical protein
LPECPPVHKALSVMHKSNVVCPPVTDKVKKGKSLLGFNDMQKKKSKEEGVYLTIKEEDRIIIIL